MDNPSCSSSLDRLTENRAVRPTCHCLHVFADEIQQTIDENGLTSVRQVTSACGAGGGCTACHRHIKRMLAEAAAARTEETSGAVLGFA